MDVWSEVFICLDSWLCSWQPREKNGIPQKRNSASFWKCQSCVKSAKFRTPQVPLTLFAPARHSREMRRGPRIFCGVALILLLCSLCCSIPAAGDPTEQEIELLNRRVKERPHDFIALTMLGQAHLRRALESGDLATYQNAESAFQAARVEFPDVRRSVKRAGFCADGAASFQRGS